MAAGFSLDYNQLEAFEGFLSERINKQIKEGNILPTLKIDGLIAVEGASLDLVSTIEMIGPFGTGNAEPRLAFSNVRIAKAVVVGSEHVRCFISELESKKQLSAIAFKSVDTELGRALLQHNGVPLTIVGRLRKNTWQGRHSVQLLIDDAARTSV